MEKNPNMEENEMKNMEKLIWGNRGILYSMKNNKNKKMMVIIWVHIEKREYGVYKL